MITVEGPNLNQRAARAKGIFRAVMLEKLQRDAYGFYKTFQNGIRSKRFGLEGLKQITIDAKKAKGYSRPNVPLYGLGDKHQRSYIKMFEVKRATDGWEAITSKKLHHEAGIPLSAMFAVHERGRTINGVRIPKRPAGKKAYAAYLKSSQYKSIGPKIRAAVSKYVTTGDEGPVKALQTKIRAEISGLKQATK